MYVALAPTVVIASQGFTRASPFIFVSPTSTIQTDIPSESLTNQYSCLPLPLTNLILSEDGTGLFAKLAINSNILLIISVDEFTKNLANNLYHPISKIYIWIFSTHMLIN